MNQLTLFDTPVPPKRSLTLEETKALIRRVVDQKCGILQMGKIVYKRNWLYHNPDMEAFVYPLAKGLQLDPQTFAQARQDALDAYNAVIAWARLPNGEILERIDQP